MLVSLCGGGVIADDCAVSDATIMNIRVISLRARRRDRRIFSPDGVTRLCSVERWLQNDKITAPPTQTVSEIHQSPIYGHVRARSHS
ncbi:hypothetical protein MRB53_039310 [Persea americana]|nr:hypothetical protein MRB53_039310 [Persea americana]